jgi:hypothetical protein
MPAVSKSQLPGFTRFESLAPEAASQQVRNWAETWPSQGLHAARPVAAPTGGQLPAAAPAFHAAPCHAFLRGSESHRSCLQQSWPFKRQEHVLCSIR